jgi:uncharacterized protein (TIRG00374 family)
MIKAIITIFKISFTICIIVYILNFTDFKNIFDIISNSNKILLMLSFILLVFVTFLQANRFCWVADNFKITLNVFESWKNISIGILFNQVLPSTIGGDGFRFLNLKEMNHDTKSSFKSIIIDRIYGLLSLCVICGLGSLAMLHVNFDSKFIIVSLVISLTSIVMFFLVPFILKKFFFNFSKKVRIFNLLNDLQLFNKNKIVIKVFLISILVHIIVSLIGYLILLSFNVKVNIWPFIWLFSSSLLISTIPISIGGWGFREGIFILSMQLINIKMETAIAISLIYAFETSVIGLFGGIIWSAKLITKKPKITFLSK